MNAAEMHAFEQAMMDDPFLDDAVDGYRTSLNKINVQADLTELKERMEEKKQKNGIVIKGSFRQWMSIAAGLIILLGASIVLYRMFNQTELKNTAPVAELKKTDTAAVVKIPTQVDSNTVAVNDNAKIIVTPPATAPSYKTEKPVKDFETATVPVNEPAVAETKPAIVKEQPVASGSVAAVQSKVNEDQTLNEVVVKKQEERKKSQKRGKYLCVLQRNIFIGL